MGTPVVELKNVSMIFRRGWLIKKPGAHAVTNVSLALPEAGILALVGESGCGKTTLGRIALGLIKPTAGEVLWEGKNIWQMGREEFNKLRPMAQLVHQDSYAALNPVRTIYQTLSAPLLYHGTRRSEVRGKAEELLKFVGVYPPSYFLDKYPHHLSGGLRQRIVLARSLIPQPKFIVADEPVSMIDVSLRLSVLDLMLRMNKELGTAFLYITHDLATARYIGREGWIAVMYLGMIVETGEFEEVFQKPRHPYLQALLSAAPVPDPKIAKRKRPLPLKSLEIPSAENPPSGCRFHPRCPYAEDICAQEIPALRSLDNRLIACHLAERIPEWHLL